MLSKTALKDYYFTINMEYPYIEKMLEYTDCTRCSHTCVCRGF